MAGIQIWQVWIACLAGLWIFSTATIATWAYSIIYPTPTAPVTFAAPGNDEGPLTFYYNLAVGGGFGRGVNVLVFRGQNTSQQEVKLVSAKIISTLTGDIVDLKVLAENVATDIKNLNLIPSGAPIEMHALFQPPESELQDAFLKKWSKFDLIVRDEKREYRLQFNEGSIAAFFPGKIGPRITAKPTGAGD